MRPVKAAPSTSPDGPRISTSTLGTGRPAEPSRARTAGSVDRIAERCSSGPEHRDRRARLGQPVGVDEVDLRPVVHRALDHADGHRRAAVGQRLQRGHRPVRVRLDDPREHRRHHQCVSHALAPHQLQPLLTGELLEHDAPTSRIQVRDRVRDRRDVIGRNAHQRGIAGLGPPELDRAQHIADQILVTQQDALRRRRRAAGVDDHRRRVHLLRHRTLVVRRIGPVRRARRVQPLLRREHRQPEPLQKGVEPLLGDHDGTHVLEQQHLELLGAQPVVQRHQRNTSSSRREQRRGEARAVHVQVDQGLRVPLTQERRPADSESPQILGGVPGAMAPHQQAVAVAISRHVEKHRQIHLFVHPSEEHTTFVFTGTRPDW